MTAACFGLGGPPRVGRLIRSSDGCDNPIPRAASALVELAMTCPGLHYCATSRLPDAENYPYHLLHSLRQGGELQLDAKKYLAHSNRQRESDEAH